MPEEFFFGEGLIFGLIDNGVLAFATILGLDIDKYFKGAEFMVQFTGH